MCCRMMKELCIVWLDPKPRKLTKVQCQSLPGKNNLTFQDVKKKNSVNSCRLLEKSLNYDFKLFLDGFSKYFHDLFLN